MNAAVDQASNFTWVDHTDWLADPGLPAGHRKRNWGCRLPRACVFYRLLEVTNRLPVADLLHLELSTPYLRQESQKPRI
jgi:hypothetical protein